ncbi:MAG: hypothetical protein LBK98_10360 [Peptococcaceae bacterium]|jgi:hypothetical protein|nr:hypothetical protein [Peptococcaceae bacterium]
MSLTVGNVVANYTYTYQNKLRPRLDKDDNGYLGKAEISNYASAYQKTTGQTLDVDKIMSTYDEDGDDRLSYREQDQMNLADALGMDNLAKAWAASNTVQTPIEDTTDSAGTGTGSGGASAPAQTNPGQKPDKLPNPVEGDWFDGLSSAKKISLFNVVARAEQNNYFFNNLQIFNRSSLFNPYSSRGLFANANVISGGMLNMFA